MLTLLELLQSGGTRTMAELADRLGVDERTVRRVPAHTPGYRVPPLMLSDDEALAVLLGLVAGRG
ncbi:AsnC family transcriptional regulator [Microbispora sp. NBC_01189]|uniref:HTH domain-containing protein n=1 Tax=Microbispora sp. NBC_01189 TaxID=2903583 RepID=UPI002E12C132|nr:AsnC family transcriptional regulator [Microbispora sp. NBC_01189]